MGAISANEVNSARMSFVYDNLALLANNVYGSQKDPAIFCNLCYSLARSIDYAISNNDVPTKAQDLPKLMKQICEKRNSLQVKAVIMVLMISIKNACKTGWFSDKDKEELQSLINEIGSDFFGCGDNDIGQSSSLITITAIMERFYPRMKMGQIVASLEVKPGYGAFAVDLHFSKTMQYSPQEKIRLFVAQKDNIETSACIISPPQVNFLVNGRGINGRTNVYLDTGPQLPTIISHMIKLGPNLLQAVGHFTGHYVIAVAFMSTAPSPDSSVLQNYVQPTVATLDSDSDIIEGPSRISLNCPISYTRIKVPVKGHSCKHLQCFDFYNFVDINSRRPSWRCPHCNQYVCYLDIRIDQNMLKVLGEVAENVTEVIISADGSWKAILENDYGDGQSFEDSLNHLNERTQQDSTAPPDVLDLTEVDDDMDICNFNTQDTKPSLGTLKNQSVPSSFNVSSAMNMSGNNQNFVTVLDDDFWSGISTDGITASRSGVPMDNSISASSFIDHMQSAVFTDAITPVLNQGGRFHGHINPLSTPVLLDQNNLQIQVTNLTENNQNGRLTSVPRHITRTPIAVQALPAQSPASGQQYSSRTNVSSTPQVGHHGNPRFATNVASSFQPPSTVQNRNPQERCFTPGQSVQQAPSVGRPPVGLLTEFHNAHLQQTFNPRMYLIPNQSPRVPNQIPQVPNQSPRVPNQSPQVPNQSPRVVQPPLQLQRPMGQVGSSPYRPYGGSAYATMTNRQHPRMMVSQRVEMSRQSAATSLQNQTSRSAHSFQPVSVSDGLRTSAVELRNNRGMSQTVPMADGSVDPSTDQNWRPTGRMRGSLTGKAYSSALSQLMIQPTQTVQSARPSSNMNPTPSSIPSIPALSSNNRNPHAPQTK